MYKVIIIVLVCLIYFIYSLQGKSQGKTKEDFETTYQYYPNNCKKFYLQYKDEWLGGRGGKRVPLNLIMDYCKFQEENKIKHKRC